MEAKDHINIYGVKTIKEVLKKSGFKKVFFIQLSPIQSVSGSKNIVKIFIKNLWSIFSKILFKVSGGFININNLFVVAIKAR